MQDSIHTYFKLGVVSAMMYAPSLQQGMTWPEVVKTVARDDYFDVVEVNPIPDAAQQEEVAALARQGHLTLCYGGQGRLLGSGLNPNDLDEAGRRKAEDTLKAGVDEAVRLGSAGMAFLSGHWTMERREEAYRQLLKTTRAVCDYAKDRGIRVELEVFDHDIDKKSLLGPAPLAARFAADMRTTHSNFGLMVDLSHIPMTRETPQFVIRTLRPYITHLHMGNTVVDDPAHTAYGDLHPRFGFPNGENDTAQLLDFLRVLKQEGLFSKEDPLVLSFEVKPWDKEDVETVLANSKRVLHRAWALLED